MPGRFAAPCSILFSEELTAVLADTFPIQTARRGRRFIRTSFANTMAYVRLDRATLSVRHPLFYAFGQIGQS
jgi:hypothetical protein